MRFAVLADIHGNSIALEAVLSDMDGLGISAAVNLGDHFSGPLDAYGTAELLMQQDFPSIRGNHDRYLLEQEPEAMGPSDQVAHAQLEDRHFDWLKSLPPTRSVFDDVFMCHGTPSSDETYLLERVESDGTVRQATLSDLAPEVDGIDANLILCGHTHLPRVARLRDGQTVLNPGSVGCPGYDDDFPVYHRIQTGTPNASYAIVEMTEVAPVINFRSIPYGHEKAAELALANMRPDWARALATGWFDE